MFVSVLCRVYAVKHKDYIQQILGYRAEEGGGMNELKPIDMTHGATTR